PEEAEGEQDEVALELELGAGDLLHGHAPVVAHPVDADAMQPRDVALRVAGEPLRVDAPVADDALLVRARGAQDHRPVGPHQRRSRVRWLRQRLELRDRARALAVGGAEAIGAGVPAAEDDDALARGAELVRHGVTGDDLVLLWEEVHREMDAAQLAARDGEIT